MNPNRRKPLAPRPDKVAAIVVHLPEMKGYHEQRLAVVKKSLTSLSQTAPELSILIWDNGSCAVLREWLMDYKPETLILSENIGKASAQAAIARMLPGETLIFYADDDMLYYPGWLESHMDILTTFPPCVVTGNPTRRAFGFANKNTRAWADAHGKVTQGEFVKDEWERDYSASTGVTKLAPHHDNEAMIEYKGVSALLTSHHCQFATRARDMVRFTDFMDIATRNEIEVDNRIDELGLLRLSTRERTTRHLGNVLDADLLSH